MREPPHHVAAPVAAPAAPQSSQPAAVPELDPVAARRWRSLKRAASPWLHEEVGQRMAQRLDWLVQRPGTWVSWNPALGGWQAQQTLAARYPEAQLLTLDEQGRALAPALPEQAAAPTTTAVPAALAPAALAPLPPRRTASAAPFGPGQADWLWANMALHLYARPQALLAHWRGWLRPEGLLFFSCLGPDTLMELRDIYQTLGWPPPHQPFTDMHDWGDLLLESGFSDPVLDMERLRLSYPSAERLLQDLREGGRNLHRQRAPGLRGHAHRQRLLQALEQHLPRNAEGQLCLTVEVVYGHAVKAMPRVPLAATTTVALDEMRSLLQRSKQTATPKPCP